MTAYPVARFVGEDPRTGLCGWQLPMVSLRSDFSCPEGLRVYDVRILYPENYPYEEHVKLVEPLVPEACGGHLFRDGSICLHVGWDPEHGTVVQAIEGIFVYLVQYEHALCDRAGWPRSNRVSAQTERLAAYMAALNQRLYWEGWL